MLSESTNHWWLSESTNEGAEVIKSRNVQLLAGQKQRACENAFYSATPIQFRHRQDRIPARTAHTLPAIDYAEDGDLQVNGADEAGSWGLLLVAVVICLAMTAYASLFLL